MTEPQASMQLFDTHCHFDLFRDPSNVVKAVQSEEVYTVAVTNAPSVFPGTHEMCEGTRYIRPALGLHPELAVERQGELPLFREQLERTRYVGEVGLDYSGPDEGARQVQRKVFSGILEACAHAGGKVLTVHSRRAASDVIDAIGPRFPGQVVLHWYSGSLSDLERALDYGFFFSVNPAMTQGRRFRSIVNRIPKQRLLTETDGPFVEWKGRPAMPPDVQEVLVRLGEVWDQPAAQVGGQLFENFRTLLEDRGGSHSVRAYTGS